MVGFANSSFQKAQHRATLRHMQNLRIEDVPFRKLREHRDATGIPMSRTVGDLILSHFGMPRRQSPQTVKPAKKQKA